MTKFASKFIAWSLPAFALALTAQGGGYTNNFDTSADFVASGVIGTMWDGVYLTGGDIPGGDIGGDGRGTTLMANETYVPGYLTLQSSSSTWSGTADDGFFLYKMVSGDFDVSVQNVAPFDPQAYHNAGLLARAALPSGSPVSLNGTNLENWVSLTRFQQYDLGEEVRYAVEGTDTEFLLTPSANSETNASRYLRITRAGDVFSFYNKTNQSDGWNLLASTNRADLTGRPMQVGIEQAIFTGNSPIAYFTDFQLTGPSVAVSTPPANPTGLTMSVANSNSLTFSWTAGSGSDGSILVVSANGPITHRPADGLTYTAITNFSSVSNYVGGTRVHAVYAGTGNSVTVTGFGGSNNLYSAAVFSYTGTGSATVYGATPATNSKLGPGTLVAVSFTVSPTNVPIGGVGVATLMATYSSGDSYDVSAATGTTWGSSDSSTISVSSGILSALTSGSATITATFEGITGNRLVAAHAPAYTDNFSVNHDYLVLGLPGSTWDGLYTKAGDFAGGNNGGAGAVASIVSANSVTNNQLVVRANNTEWAGAADDGFLLFKNVAGDFQAAVHVSSLQKSAYHFAGLMARAANANGSPYGGSENWVYLGLFEQWDVALDARTAINGADNENVWSSSTQENLWILMRRDNGTNFLFYRKSNETDPWTPMPEQTIVREDLAGVAMQVGLFQATYTANNGTVTFEKFLLDSTGIHTNVPVGVASDLTIDMGLHNTLVLNWTPGAGSTGSVVVVRQAAPVNGQPQYGVTYTGNPVFGLGSQIGNGNYVVYVGSGSTVTVTNLTAGSTYYAAVYSYGGSGDTTAYACQDSGVTNYFLGVLESIHMTIPKPHVPAGGITKAPVTGMYSGVPVDITMAATFISSDANVLAGSSGLVTGLTNGAANIIATFGGFGATNAITVYKPLFTDDFSASHDYLANKVAGSSWDGVYLAQGDIPGTTFSGTGVTLTADANTSSNSLLTVVNQTGGWEAAQNDGFFLFKLVPGDFQVAVRVDSVDTNSYNQPGLMARAHQAGGAAPTNGETWVSLVFPGKWGFASIGRMVVGGAQSTSLDAGDYTRNWLLIVREQGTNFSFYQRAAVTDPWTPTPLAKVFSDASLAGNLQVGIINSPYGAAANGVASFGSFMLDTGLPTLKVTSSGSSVIISWPEGPGTLQSTTSLIPTSWQNVSASPVLSGGMNTVTLPATNSTSFFRLAK